MKKLFFTLCAFYAILICNAGGGVWDTQSAGAYVHTYISLSGIYNTDVYDSNPSGVYGTFFVNPEYSCTDDAWLFRTYRVTGTIDYSNVPETCADSKYHKNDSRVVTFATSGDNDTMWGVNSAFDFGDKHIRSLGRGGSAGVVKPIRAGIFAVATSKVAKLRQDAKELGFTIASIDLDVSKYFTTGVEYSVHICEDASACTARVTNNDCLHGVSNLNDHIDCVAVKGVKFYGVSVESTGISDQDYAYHLFTWSASGDNRIRFYSDDEHNDEIVFAFVSLEKDSEDPPVEKPDNSDPTPSGSGVEIDYEKLTQALTDSTLICQ